MNYFIDSNNKERSSIDHPLRVMIVDGHEIFRYGLRDFINSIEGFQVVAEANNCMEALAQAETLPIDLVLLDMFLSDGDGIQATHHLRQKLTPPPYVIILSARVYDDLLVNAILAGAHGYLTKDMPAREITKILQGFQRGELALPPLAITDLVQLLVQKYKEMLAALATYQQARVPTAAITPSPTSELNHIRLTSNEATHIFTPQEAKVLQLLRHGQSNKQIAIHLSISPYTVGKHVQNILRKLGATNRTQAVSYTSFEGDDNHRERVKVNTTIEMPTAFKEL